MKRFCWLSIFLGMALTVSACHRSPPLSSQEQATVTALTSNLTTRCVGRYLIDVPADAATFGTIRVNDVDIEATAMTLEDYRKAMQTRSDELDRAKSVYGYRFVYANTVIKGIPESRYFISLGGVDTKPDSNRLIEAYRWDNGYQIKMLIEADDAENSVYYKDDPRARDATYMNDLPEKTRLVISLLDHARGSADDEMPSEPGVCFQGGWLVGKPWEKEVVSVQFVPNDHPDVSINLETDSSILQDDTLLDRGAQIHDGMKNANGRTIRKGKVPLAGMAAEEWLISGTTTLKVQGFIFGLEANSKSGSPQTPLVNLDMDVGSRNRVLVLKEVYELDKASLTEGESLGVWDAVSRTLRPRPNAF